MAYVPDQGDIVELDLDPSAGIEIAKRRPAFVISRKIFNKHTNLAIVAPITSTIRGVGIEVELAKSDDRKISGAILVYQLRSIDFRERRMSFVEKAQVDEITKVINIAQTITK